MQEHRFHRLSKFKIFTSLLVLILWILEHDLPGVTAKSSGN